MAYPTVGALVEYATASGSGLERIKLASAPESVLAAGDPLPELDAPPTGTPGWFFEETTGVITISHDTGPVVVNPAVSAVPGNDPRAYTDTVLRLRPTIPQESGRAAIGVDLAREGHLHLAVYDLRGRLVRELIPGSRFTAGSHVISWDGRDRHGQRMCQAVS